MIKTAQLIRAKQVLDAILAVKPRYGPGEWPPTEEQCTEMNKKIYHERMMIIYRALVDLHG